MCKMFNTNGNHLQLNYSFNRKTIWRKGFKIQRVIFFFNSFKIAYFISVCALLQPLAANIRAECYIYVKIRLVNYEL